MKPRSMYEVLLTARRTMQLAVVADIKVHSPRDGALLDTDRLDTYVDILLEGGVSALSTPTDPVYFAGGMQVAAQIRARTGLPLMRKEFFCTPRQLQDSVDAGFDAVQLSVNTTGAHQLGRLHQHAQKLGLEVVFGIHTRAHLDVALELDPVAIGVNNRDMLALERDPGSVRVTEEMIAHVPSEVLVLSESAYSTVDDVVRAGAAGAEAVLIGTALAQADDPAKLVRSMREETWLCAR